MSSVVNKHLTVKVKDLTIKVRSTTLGHVRDACRDMASDLGYVFTVTCYHRQTSVN